MTEFSASKPAPDQITRLQGARVLLPDGWGDHHSVLLQAGRILDVVPDADLPDGHPSHETIGLPPGSILAPGFIDAQVNGGGGVLFNADPSAEAIQRIADAHLATGTAGLLPTLITDTPEKMHRAADALRAVADDPRVLGLHFEGPFISPRKPGVHDPRHIRAMTAGDVAFFIGLAAEFPNHRILVTLAPECVPPAFLLRLAEAGVILSAGHTAASAAEIQTAIQHGLRGFTHLFNAMPAPASRDPGPVPAAVLDPGTWCGIIADGIHVDPLMLRWAIAAKPPEKTFLVTDSMPPLGTELTGFDLDDRTITRELGRLTAKDGTLAGADITMPQSVRNAMALLGVEPGQALRMAARYPAEFLGLEAERGTIAPGRRADLILLSPGFDILMPRVGTGQWPAASC